MARPGDHAVNISQVVYANGGRNLLAGFGDFAHWTDDYHVPPPALADPLQQVHLESARLSSMAVQRDLKADESPLNHGMQRVFTSCNGHPLLISPYALGKGTFMQNPMPYQRVDYFRM